MADFSEALLGMKRNQGWRRRAHKTNKFFCLRPASETSMAYLEIRYDDGRRSPWIPVQCDMLEDDWYEVILHG